MRPLPELSAQVTVKGDADISAQVHDISIGGVGLWIQRGRFEHAPDERIEVEMTLGDKTIHLAAVVRHVRQDQTIAGIQFVDVSAEAQPVINRYVSELAERGSSA